MGNKENYDILSQRNKASVLYMLHALPVLAKQGQSSTYTYTVRKTKTFH